MPDSPQNVGRRLELRPRSGERGYDSLSRNSLGREISGLDGARAGTAKTLLARSPLGAMSCVLHHASYGNCPTND